MDENFIPVFGMITAIIINLGLFTAIILAIYYNVKARNKERMALIERGVDLSEIYKKKESGNGFFKFGFILIGIALGLVFGMIFSKLELFPPVVSYFAFILLFGGISVLVANYLVAKKKME
jgi:Flp pilus assembly protein TadB